MGQKFQEEILSLSGDIKNLRLARKLEEERTVISYQLD